MVAGAFPPRCAYQSGRCVAGRAPKREMHAASIRLNSSTRNPTNASTRTPPDGVAKRAAALEAALRDAALRVDPERRAAFVEPSTTAQLRATIVAEQAEWAKLIAAFGLAAR